MSFSRRLKALFPLAVLGHVVLWMGFAGAGWAAFQLYHEVARIQEQRGVHSLHPGLRRDVWNEVYVNWLVMMGCLIVSCMGGVLCHLGGKATNKNPGGQVPTGRSHRAHFSRRDRARPDNT
jgi:hypothetical protein